MPPTLGLLVGLLQDCALVPVGCAIGWVMLCGAISSLRFTQAIKTSNRQQWGIYTLTLIVGVYSHPFFGLIMLFQGLYLVTLIDQHPRDNRRDNRRNNRKDHRRDNRRDDHQLVRNAYWGSTLFALATWIPWLSVVLHPA
jgi:uncharacterized membrane protein